MAADASSQECPANSSRCRAPSSACAKCAARPTTPLRVISAAVRSTSRASSLGRSDPVAGRLIAYRGGVPIAVLEGDSVRALTSVEPSVLDEATRAMDWRRVPALLR